MSLTHQLTKVEGGGTLTDYNPEHGLKSIAVAEAAETYFARAKDATKLFDAIETKLAEQRRFILWWDEQEKQHGKLGSRSETQFTRLDSLGVDKLTVSRWRKRLKEPSKYEDALAAAQERCRRVCEADKGATEQRGASGTGENEWYTPPEYLRLVRKVLGEIDLDPASSEAAQQHVQAARYFSLDDDGLKQDWNGRVWLNPPYAQPYIAEFVAKIVAERQAGRVTAAIMLTHNYTDTAWFHEAGPVADAICFMRGRVKFYDAKGNIAAPTQGQAFFYFGDDVTAFCSTFSTIGFCVLPWTGEV